MKKLKEKMLRIHKQSGGKLQMKKLGLKMLATCLALTMAFAIAALEGRAEQETDVSKVGHIPVAMAAPRLDEPPTIPEPPGVPEPPHTPEPPQPPAPPAVPEPPIPEDGRLIATYGGYGIDYLTLGDYGRIMVGGTMGDAELDLLFAGDEASGTIILGERQFEVELVKVSSNLVADGTSLVHKSIEGGALFEGDLVGQEGRVTLIRYQDVVVGEIDLGEVVYGFSLAASMLSAGTILVADNDEYVEKLIQMGILEEIEPVVIPPIPQPESFDDTSPLPGCYQDMPSLHELLAAGDDDIIPMMLSDPDLMERFLPELRYLVDLNENVLRVIAHYTLRHIQDDAITADHVHGLLRGLIDETGHERARCELVAVLGGDCCRHLAKQAEPLLQPAGLFPWRSFDVRGVGDEEFRALKGANWQTHIRDRLEEADNPLVRYFRLNAVVDTTYVAWDSNDAVTRLVDFHPELRAEVPLPAGIEVVAAWSSQTMQCSAWGWGELGRHGNLGNYMMTHTRAGVHEWRVAWHEFSHLFGCTCFGMGHTYHCTWNANRPYYICIMSSHFQSATGVHPKAWCPHCQVDLFENRACAF